MGGGVIMSENTTIKRIMHKPTSDRRLPDGFVYQGWRKVRKDGTVFFQGQTRKSEKLMPYVGAYVYCVIEDMWAINITIHPEGFDHEDNRQFCYGRPSRVIVPDNV
jgi:hypothetical protein